MTEETANNDQNDIVGNPHKKKKNCITPGIHNNILLSKKQSGYLAKKHSFLSMI